MADPAPGLRLLRLPQLVYWKIVKLMYLLEQYNLSQLSKRSQYLVKAINRREKVDVILSFRSFSNVIVENKNLQEAFTTKLISFEHAKQCVQLLGDTFHLTPVTLKFTNCNPICYHVIPFLKQNGLKIDIISVFKNVNQYLNHETYKMILAECGDVRKVSIMMKTLPDLQIDIPPLFQCDDLYLDDASWVTVDHLVDYFMDCKSLVLSSPKIILKHLKPFLKRWVEGCKMESFSMPIKYASHLVTHTSLREIFQGLRAPQVREAEVGNLRYVFGRGACFLIRDVNGKVAIVYIYGPMVHLETQAVVLQRW